MGSKGHKSAQKVARGSIRRQARNTANHSQLKTDVAKAEKLIAAGDSTAKDAIKRASSALDKAVGKKNIHANAAARKKSRLMKKLNKGAAPAKAKAA